MRKKTIADKIAEKTFNSKEIQNSWTIHEAAFGPILTPAFIEDYQAKITVTAALNLISNRKLKEALNKLEQLKKFIETNEDQALWLFMMGLVFEFAGAKDQMIQCYSECNSLNHNFYMPYLKVAKVAQNTSLDYACHSYEKAIQCLMMQDTKHIGIQTILGSAYTNYAGACIMKHDYEHAKELLDKSIEILPTLKGRDLTIAIYHAATHNTEKALEHLEKEKDFPTYTITKQIVDDILNDKHFQFNVFDIDEEAISNFWTWFTENEQILINYIQNNENDPLIQTINEQLKKVFSQLKVELEFGIMIEQDYYELEFCDNYAVALTKGYEQLLQKAPQLNKWKFKLIH